jgi:hypothetical protein
VLLLEAKLLTLADDDDKTLLERRRTSHATSEGAPNEAVESLKRSFEAAVEAERFKELKPGLKDSDESKFGSSKEGG